MTIGSKTPANITPMAQEGIDIVMTVVMGGLMVGLMTSPNTQGRSEGDLLEVS
jgi:hypothetical protein